MNDVLQKDTTLHVEKVGWTVAKAFLLIVLVATMIQSTTQVALTAGKTGARTLISARIQPERMQTLAVSFPVTVVTVLRREGDRVTAGEPIMELESAESHLLLASARRRVEIAAGRLKAAGGGARKSVYQKEQDRSAAQLVAAARRRLASYSTADYEAAYNAAKIRRIRIGELVGQQLATAAELDAARREEANEHRNMKATNETLARLKDDLENAVSHQKLVELQAAGPVGDDSSLARLELEQAQQDLQILESRADALRVTAPFSGVLLSGLPNPGDRLVAGAPLARVADDSKLLLVAAVAPEIARHLTPGSSVQVRLPGDPPQTAAGTVLSNAPAPDQGDGGYVIRVSVAGARSSSLLAGGGGAIEILHEESPWRFRF